MTTVYAIHNVQHALQALKELIAPDRWADTPLPVIAAPGWWMEELRKEMNVDEGFEPGEIHGCTVLRKDELTEPMLIDHDGKMYPILPKWQRAKAADTEGGEA
jgi:hypothetical protein